MQGQVAMLQRWHTNTVGETAGEKAGVYLFDGEIKKSLKLVNEEWYSTMQTKAQDYKQEKQRAG